MATDNESDITRPTAQDGPDRRSKGKVCFINVSDGGVPKRPVDQAAVTAAGVEGDGHNNTRSHGGPNKAVCIFSLERIEAMQAEGHPIAPGTTGENLTISGLDWDALARGARLRVGGALIELTEYTVPCHKIAASFTQGRIDRIDQQAHPGWSRLYGRVLEDALVRPGDGVLVTDH